MRARPILLLSLLLTLPYLAAAQADTDPPVAHAGTPGWNELITGSTWVRGWAVDASGVTSVQFLVDGSTSYAIVNPWYGRYVPGACDLHSYLNDPNCPYVGWEAELDTTRLTNGSHNLTVKAWDAAGNLWQFTRPIQVDNPVPDTDPPVAHAGTPGWNELLRGTDLIQGWATDASGVSLVQFLVDGSSTGIVNPWYGRYVSQACSLHSYLGDPNCPYVGWEATLDTTRLSDGSHTFTVKASDAAGNLWRYDRPIRVDNRAPSVTITSPDEGEVVRTTQQIYVQSSDWGTTGSGVARVEFRVNGALLYTDTSSPYSYLWDTQSQGNEGTNTISVKSFDVAGNKTTVSRVVTVDNTPPEASLTAPANGALVRGARTVKATASDNIGIANVGFWIDDQSIAWDATAPYAASWDTTTVSDGNHSIYAIAWDEGGLSDQSSTAWVTVDNTRPTISLSGPASGSVATGTVEWSASASDANGIQRVNFYVDGVNSRADSNAPYTFSWDTSSLSGGDHTINARALDQAGNVKWAGQRTLTVDRTPPVLDLREPSAGDIVGGTETIIVHAQDLESPGDEIDRLEYWVNGQLLATQQSQGVYFFNYYWNTEADGVEGSNTILVKAFDQAGNVASDSHQVVVDNHLPTATMTAPAAGAYVRGTVTLKADGSDGSGLQSMRFWVDGAHLSGDATSPYTASWDTTGAADGLHSLYAVAWDEAGNPGQSDTIQVTVDNTAPGATLTAPANGETVGGDVVLTVSASDTHGIADVRFFVDGARVTIDSTAPYAYTWDTISAGNGPHNIVVRAFDQAGNSTWSATHTVTVFNPDFSLSFVQEAGLELDTRGVEPGGTTDLAVRFTRTDGSSDPASLSVTGLPAGISASHPSQVWPGQTATVQLTADLGAADATHPFQVVASASGESSTVAGSLIVADLPNITSVSPQTIPAGTVATVTLTGTDFEGADVWFATEKPDPGSPDRIFPVATVLSVAPGGTSVQAEIDATAPGVEGYYNLVVTNSAGGAAAPIRVLPDRPVVEVYTPSEPSESDVYVFVASGANLADATLSASDPSITFLEVEASDTEILGFMHVATGAPPTAEVYVSSSKGSVTLPIEVMSAPVASRTGNVITGQSTTDPGLLIQQFAPFGGSFDEEPWWAWDPPTDPVFEVPCGGVKRPIHETWSYTYQISDLLGREGKEVLDLLKTLPVGVPYKLDLTILELYAEFEIRVFFKCRISLEHGLRFTDIDVCLSGQARMEVIERHSVTCEFDACLAAGFAGGCETTGAFASLGSFWIESSTSCTQAKDISYSPEGEPDPDPHGDRLVEVLAEGCCPDTVSFHGSGTSSGGHPFDETILEAETDVEPGSCGGSGVATDTDYTVIAWLDEGPPRDAVTQLAPLADNGLRTVLPELGPAGLFNRLSCVDMFLALQVGALQLAPIHTDADRRYVNAWVLAFGGDPPPPSTFQSLDLLVGDLANYSVGRQYRVMAHLATTHDGTQIEIREPVLAQAGLTKDPCTGLRFPVVSETDRHDDHGAHGVRSNNAFVLTEARVGASGQLVDRTLNCPTCDVGETTPWIWAVIRVDPAGELNPGQGIAFGGIDHQMFPTYAVYKDGVKIFSSQQSDHEQFIALDATSERREEEIP